MRASNESVEMLLMIIIGTGREVRFCIQKIGDVSVLYYREKETGDSKRPSLRVVAVEDLRETLIGVHEQVCHGGQTRMEKYLVEHVLEVSISPLQTPLVLRMAWPAVHDLCALPEFINPGH